MKYKKPYLLTRDIRDIEIKVDEILNKNKNKLKNIETKNNINEILFKDSKDTLVKIRNKDFSPEQKSRESIYFVKKKKSQKIQKENTKKSEKTTDKKKSLFAKKSKKNETEEIAKLSSDETEWLNQRIKNAKKDKDDKKFEKKTESTTEIDPSFLNQIKPLDQQKGEDTLDKKDLEAIPPKSPDDKEISDSEKEEEIIIGKKQETSPKKESDTQDEDHSKDSPQVTPPSTEKNLDGSLEKNEDEDTSHLDVIKPIDEKIDSDKPEESPLEESEHTQNDTSFQQEPQNIADDAFQQDPLKKVKQPLPSPTEIKLDDIRPDDEIKFQNVANSLKLATLKNLGYTEGTWEELDFYPIHEPFAYVEIIRETESLDKRYILVEVELYDEEARILQFIKDTMYSTSIRTEELEEKGEQHYLQEKVDQILQDYMISLIPQSKKKIIYFLEKQFLGLERLETLMRDPNIEDISCDGANVPFFLYHRRYGSLKSNVEFGNEDELSAFVIKLAQKCGKHISISEPMIDATMPDGSRIQMTLSTEVTTKGSTFTIRKFKEDPFSPPDLIEFNSMSSEMVAYLWLAVENGINALIAGGTAAGKTSTLNAISLFIPRESKIVSIEETREINLPHPNWIPGVSRSGFGEVVGNKVVGEIDLYDLMKAALRQRPEFIIVGEIRGREAYVLFQAMATGHTTYSTVHADSAQSLIHRLEGKPINIPRIMLQALDIVCIQVISRVKNKRARRCKQIIEIIDIDPTTKEILTNEVFHWDPVDDRFIYSGKSYILERIRSEKDLNREQMTTEIKNRSLLLEWMNKTNIREFKKVATLIAQYFDDPEKIMKKIKEDT